MQLLQKLLFYSGIKIIERKHDMIFLLILLPFTLQAMDFSKAILPKSKSTSCLRKLKRKTRSHLIINEDPDLEIGEPLLGSISDTRSFLAPRDVGFELGKMKGQLSVIKRVTCCNCFTSLAVQCCCFSTIWLILFIKIFNGHIDFDL